MIPKEHHIGQFFIQVNGTDVAPEIMRQLDDAIVEDDLAQPSMFTLRFNDPGLKLIDGELFQIGYEVKLGAAGDNGKPGLIMIGEVTSFETVLEQHNMTLLVRGYDRSHRLHRGCRTRTFVNKTDDDIVQEIAREVGLRAEITSVGVLHRYLMQHNQTDMEFLHERASALGYRVTVTDKQLQFHPVEHTPPEAPALDFGVNLLSFRSRLSATAQPSDVEVRGWDPLSKRAIVGVCRQPSRQPPINRGKTAAAVAEQAFSSTASVVISDWPIASQDEAERMATAILDHISGDYLAAEGKCLGVTGLRAGTTVQIKNVGNRLSGRYFITATRHEYTPTEGYTTTFYVTGRRPNSLIERMRHLTLPQRNGAATAIGIVTNVDDPEQLGRVRLKFPWLNDAHESNWARLALPLAGPQRGVFASLEVDDEVLVAFEHGDINRPYVLGALWNGKDRPPSQAVANGRRLVLFHSGDKQVIALDDVEQCITLTSGQHTVVLDKKNQRLTLTAGDAKVTMDSNSRQINIETSAELTLKGAGGSLQISASGVELQSNGSLKVDAKAMLDVTSNAIVNVRGSLVKINS